MPELDQQPAPGSEAQIIAATVDQFDGYHHDQS